MTSPSPLSHVQLHLVTNLDEALACRTWASQQPALAVDTEGTGFLPERDHARLIQFGSCDEGWALHVGMRGYGALAEQILSEHPGEIIAHNLPFDRAFIDNDLGYDIPLSRAHDTMVQHHTLNPHLSSALKSVSDRLIDRNASAGQEQLHEDFKKYGWNWATVPWNWPAYWVYAALDTVLTAQVDRILRPQILQTCPRAYDLEMATSWVTYAMSRRGAHIDRKLAFRAQQEYITRAEVRRKQIEGAYGINLSSSESVISFLQNNGITLTKQTKGGSISLDKEVLESIDHPLAGYILEYRVLQKVSSTYLENFLELTSDEHPFLHPSINSLGFSERGSGYGVKTSRMSISNPSLQNLPKAKDPTAPAWAVRGCVIARPDHVLVFCDFSQIEMRGLAHYSEDANLINAFHEGDFFINLARQVYRDPSIEEGDPRRGPIKTLGYGEIYGAGLEKTAKALGMTVSEASAFKAQWNGQYPGIKRHAKRTTDEAYRNKNQTGEAFIRSEFTNRPYYVPEGKEYALVNRKLQGAAAEIFKLKLLQLDAAGLTPYMILPVHDEIILDVPEDQLQEVCHILHTIMNDDSILRVPITAEISYGPAWNNKTKWSPAS